MHMYNQCVCVKRILDELINIGQTKNTRAMRIEMLIKREGVCEAWTEIRSAMC